MTNFIGKVMNRILQFGGVLIFIFCLGNEIHGQEAGNREQIKTLKIAFFTERLNLTPDEAAVFWPIYNEHEKKKESLRGEQRSEIRAKFKNLDAITEKEARQALSRYLELEEEEEELDKSFYLKISEEFSAVRTLRLFQAEQDFRRRLLQEYRKRKGNR
jgi:hypothetical protein